MADRVYIETTIVSYLTARPHRDLVVAGHQQITHEWWDTRRADFELCTSQLVIDEANEGDADAARDRLAILDPLVKLAIVPRALGLAFQLVYVHALPAKAET